MLWFLRVGIALLAFAAAANVGMKGPKVSNAASNVGHYTAVASVVAFGMACLFLPSLVSFAFSRRNDPSVSDATFSGSDRWRAAFDSRPSAAESWSRPARAAAPKPAADERLGELISVHESNGVRWRSIGFAVATLGFFGVAVALGVVVQIGSEKTRAKGESVPEFVYLFPGLPAFFGLCCLAALALTSGPKPTVRLYSRGLGVESPDGLNLFSWDEVAECRIPRDLRGGTWAFELTDGRRVTFDGGVKNFDPFYNTFVGEYGIPDLVENRVRRILDGDEVRIGDFTVSRDSILLGKQSVTWKEITGAVIHVYPRSGAKYLRVDVAGRMFTWQSYNLSNMKSEMVFRGVLERVAPRRIWRGA